jgi:molybdenum cofactor biosynthesis enzyme MoaA
MHRFIIIHNLRLGLATNSSSSHSLIFLSKTQHVNDYDIYGGDFGWDFFTAASHDAKMDYISLMLYQGLYGYDLDEDQTKALVREWVGNETPDGHIDHQSLISIPAEYGGKKPNRLFFEELKNMILSENVVIGGGNDNTDKSHPLIEAGNKALSIGGTVMSFNRYIARKDEKQEYWTLFNPENGAKARVSFHKPSSLSRHISSSNDDRYVGEKLVVTRSATPELVDYKITDFCSADCAYCYMGSTVNGKHGVFEDISKTLKALADMKVFEVAFGGGEPVHHPDFVKILKRARSLGIVPNFTTRNIAWLNKPIAAKIMKEAGAFAVSVDNHKQIIKLAKALDKAEIEHSRVNLHVVLGTVTREEFSRILVIAARRSLRVTLLGYKDVGRGPEFPKMDYSWWLKDIIALRKLEENAKKFTVRVLKKFHWRDKQYYVPTISIDTVVAHDYEKELVNSGIPSWLFHTVDGAFSAYVDGVNNRMGPASYDNFDKLTPFNPQSKKLAKELRTIYQGFNIDERQTSVAGSIMKGDRY